VEDAVVAEAQQQVLAARLDGLEPDAAERLDAGGAAA
jgi:hypothetical protein